MQLLNRTLLSFYDNTQYLWTADFNKDGHQDIVTSSKFYMGNGGGSFQFENLGDIKSIGIYTKIADLNGDGEPDLFVDDRSKIDLWVARGDGTFDKRSSLDYSNSNNYEMFGNSIDVGDINGDSISDIVFVDGVSLHVLHGSGNGTFPGRSDYINEDWVPGDNVAAADFNGDSNQDIAVSISNGDKHGVAVYLGRGNNTFVQGTIIHTGDVSRIQENKVFSKDINSDGYVDILYQQVSSRDYYNDAIYVLLNKGDGTFNDPIPYATENGSRIVLEDINNDGYVDLVNAYAKLIDYQYYYPRYSHVVSIHTGSGDGTFNYNATLPIAGLTLSLNIFVAAHDLNGDGYSDLAVSTNDKVLIFLNDGSGNFSGSSITAETKNSCGQLLAGDFDQDGMIDLVVNGDLSLSFLGGNGDGTFKDDVAYAAGTSWNSTIISEDFNLDGRPDLVSEGYPNLNLHLNMLQPLSTPPAAPSHLKADSGDGVVTLSWEGAVEDDVEGYNVYRALVSGGGYEKINGMLVPSPAFTDTSVTNGIEYYYTVSAVDEDDEESSFAFKVVVRPVVPDTTAPVVNIATPLGNQNLFNPSIFVSGTVSEAEAKVIVNGILGTVHKRSGTFTAYDIPLHVGENTVTVTAVDAAGNKSSDAITVVYMPPATMEGIIKDEATGQPVQYTHVRVTDSEKSQDFFGTNADGRYTFVKLIPGEVTITVESYSSTYYDPVTITKTIDSGENLVLDIALPLHPASIRASIYDSHTYNRIGSATVTISDPKKTQTLIADNYGSFESNNIAPYQVTITISKEGYETHTETRTVTNRWTNYLYLYLTPLPPSPPSGFTATPGKGFVNLSWSANSESNLANYKIYRSTTQGAGYQLIASAYSDEFSYTDGNVDAGTAYYYVLTAVNTSAQESGYSAEALAAPEALPVPSHLTATSGKGLVNLSWEALAESTISGYNIYRSAESGGGYVPIGSVNVWTTSFIDNNVDDGATYFYVVTAVNDWSRESGWSNETSAMPEEVRVSVSIISPYDEAYNATQTVIVRGSVGSVTPEVGVVIEVSGASEGQVAGYLAEVSGGSFGAQISLFPGMMNTIRAIATLPDGEQAGAAITIYAGTASEAVKLTTLPTSGVISAQTGRFDVTFKAEANVDGTVTGYSWDFDGDGSIDQVTSTPDATFGYTSPGIFYPTVTVDAGSGGGVPTKGGEGGSSYTATTVVNVMSVEAVDTLIQNKWTDMTNALIGSDVDRALTHFVGEQNGKYKKIFEALKDRLLAIFKVKEGFSLVYVYDNRIEYENIVVEGDMAYSYPVIFEKDLDGLWKISQF